MVSKCRKQHPGYIGKYKLFAHMNACTCILPLKLNAGEVGSLVANQMMHQTVLIPIKAEHVSLLFLNKC